MLKAYINYPNPHITIHGNASCSAIQQQHKKDQRVVRLDIGSLSKELNRLAMKEYQFGAQAETNDMWLELNLGDNKFERAIMDYVRILLSQHYKPFSRAKVDEHC
jgi:hypothetical protein